MNNIKSISMAYLDVPLKTPFVTSLRRVEHARDVIVILEDTDGKLSYGSATDIEKISGESLPRICNDLKTVIPKLMARLESLPPQKAFHIWLSETLLSLAPLSPAVRSAVETAFYNASNFISRTSSDGSLVPSQNFLTDYTISLGSEKQMCTQAEYAYSQGFRSLKVKLGSPNIKDDIAVLKAIRQCLERDVSFRIDANQAWDNTTCKEFIDLFADYPIELIEQPVKKTAVDDLIELTGYSHIKIFADESAFSLNEIKALAVQNACSGIVIKLLKTGGYSEALKIVDFCKENHLDIMISSMLETKVGVFSSLILASKAPANSLIDLDASFLQIGEPFDGGFFQVGPNISLTLEPITMKTELTDRLIIWHN